MSSRPELNLDWCSHAAAKYAVEKWHYSQRMPVGRMARIGVWEGQDFVGVVLFARGANKAMPSRWQCSVTEICELVRVALREHQSPVSRIVSIAIRMFCKQSPGVKLVVSYADSEQGHHGGIYQAGNWIYTGRSQGSIEWFPENRWKHNREITAGAFGGARKLQNYSHLPKRKTLGKHTYLYPLDAEMRARIAPLAKPYPKRARSIDSDASGFQQKEGGATPTRALQ